MSLMGRPLPVGDRPRAAGMLGTAVRCHRSTTHVVALAPTARALVGHSRSFANDRFQVVQSADTMQPVSLAEW